MAIVLEEEVIPSPDLLCYFSQCMALPDDKSIAGYSAWNPNGERMYLMQLGTWDFLLMFVLTVNSIQIVQATKTRQERMS